ncbi:MAG: signal recognition particle protein [Alphaproteobacteria bacterium]
MFDILTTRLSETFERLRGRGSLTEAEVADSLRDIRRALLEADVALPVVKKLIADIQAQAVGEALIKSVKPGELIVKLVHDALTKVLGEPQPFIVNAPAPAVILMCGLQGSGKTTTAAKLAKRLKEKDGKSVMLASLDIYRPAAQSQLQTLAERIGVPMLDIRAGEQPLAITTRALASAKEAKADILILDTAGRLEIDEKLMQELVDVRNLAKPAATLLVADALTGQVAVQVAQSFQSQVGITGLVFTRVDGDGRGGAILSVREVTGVPITFFGMGEGVDALEPYRPEGVASRLLGQGDVVAFVEKMQSAMQEDDTKALEEKLLSGQALTLDDLKRQLKMMTRLGSLGGLLGMLPGMGKMLEKVDASKLDKKIILRQIAVIDSMTPQERKTPTILNAKRRIRIAKGAGVEVSDVNKLLKMHEQMGQMTKMLSKMGGPSGAMGALKGMLGGKGPF